MYDLVVQSLTLTQVLALLYFAAEILFNYSMLAQIILRSLPYKWYICLVFYNLKF